MINRSLKVGSQSNTKITNDRLYEAMNATRLELKQDIVAAVSTVSQNQGRLEKKFDDLEAGRLTRLEGHYQDLAIRMTKSEDNGKVLSGKFLALGAIGMVVLSAIMSFVVSIAVKKL